jgi:hypothetical protein
MHWKGLIGFILVMCFQQLSAQERGKVTVTKDPQIDSLIARRLELNRAGLSGKNVTLSGFRVQIFSGLDRASAYSEQQKFKNRYPAIGSYVSYTQPNYRLRVGDFRTRLEAEKLMNELKMFYNSMFIFSDMIILK